MFHCLHHLGSSCPCLKLGDDLVAYSQLFRAVFNQNNELKDSKTLLGTTEFGDNYLVVPLMSDDFYKHMVDDDWLQEI